MSDRDKSQPPIGPAAEAAKAARDARRAEALRANLRRRKTQARGRDEDGQPLPATEDGAASHNMFPPISD
ncbi:hypothetical protein [Acidisoma silvae]|uniref:DUF4169 domain-containing protein n=1 Tax=Acidisoma silvae TaxID=2802396 RepID=A0A963YSN7_9PROT|nr:hypothetical protein [Acidisoma silvae]MCB8876221.1 hypothetical protein [Acidisoma silvae]